MAVCERLGADLAIDYRATDFVEAVKEFTGGRGADVIYDRWAAIRTTAARR